MEEYRMSKAEFDRFKNANLFTPKYHLQWGSSGSQFCPTKKDLFEVINDLMADTNYSITISKVIALP